MLIFDVETGPSAYAPGVDPLTEAAFGLRYISYRSFARFEGQTGGIDPGLIVWPGGSLAEASEDRYGFEYADLYDPGTGKPGLSDMMAHAAAEDAVLAVVLPTARYVGDPAGMVADLRGFLDDFYGGAFGAMPPEVVFNIGSEYYTHFGGLDPAGDYAALADLMIDEITAAEGDASINTAGVSVTIAVQAGRTLDEDAAIRAGLDAATQANVDLVLHHRFPFQTEGIDDRVDRMDAILDDWAADAAMTGAIAPGLFVSSYNVASLTREEALAEFLDANPLLDAADIDLVGRTNVAFEAFWQESLGLRAYGAEHPALLLEAFHSYAEIGMEMGSIYGADLLHPARITWRDAFGEDRVLAGGAFYEMLRESVVGTTPHRADPYDPDAAATLYSFENADKLILFVAAGEVAPGEIRLEIDGLGTEYRTLRADALSAEIRDDWRVAYDIPDTPGVDETPEAWTYADPVRTTPETQFRGNAVHLTMDAPHQIVRLSLSKTAAGEAEIAGYSSDSEAQMLIAGDVGGVEDAMADIAEVAQTLAEDDDGGAGGAAAGLLLLLPLLALGL